ncbi:MAG: dNTP triphosphohydrolase [Clostridiales bacterium]|nr:dNTP triphosphohydrolase [Candidatus Coliplasma caballi]
MKLTWNKLLCSETLAEKEKAPSSWVDYPLDPFEQDYREIISSVSFRHIQDKAQVYQLKRGNYVRTRLTHSLEVSTIAKQLGIMLVYNEKWNRIPVFKDLPVDQARAIPTVLACAGLLHDMGNPPFGHEGEYAIGFWFRKRLEDRDFTYHGTPVRDLLTERMKRELCSFDGNAQVIRTLAKCRFPSEEQEANVSYATISALLKYPVGSMECDPVSEDPRVRKSGFFLSEEALVRRIREKTGMDLPGEPYARNPLTVILEASDDIAYVTSDIEDAVSKHSIGISQLVSFMEKEVEALPEGDRNRTDAGADRSGNASQSDQSAGNLRPRGSSRPRGTASQMDELYAQLADVRLRGELCRELGSHYGRNVPRRIAEIELSSLYDRDPQKSDAPVRVSRDQRHSYHGVHHSGRSDDEILQRGRGMGWREHRRQH